MHFIAPCVSAGVDSSHGQGATTSKYIRLVNASEAGLWSMRTALHSLCLSALIVLLLLVIHLPSTLRSVRPAVDGEPADEAVEGGGAEKSESACSAKRESAEGDKYTEALLTPASFSVLDREIATFLGFGKSFLSPEFLKEITEEEEAAPSPNVQCRPPSPPSPPTSQCDNADDANNSDNVAPPPGFEDSRPPRTKPHCDVRNWRSLDRKPSLSNTRTLSAFHNLNASRKVAHHFYPNFRPIPNQSADDGRRNPCKHHQGFL